MAVADGTTFQFMWRDRSIGSDFRAGVSLHSHTMYSEESLETISRYTSKMPLRRPWDSIGRSRIRRGRRPARLSECVLDASALAAPGLPVGREADSSPISTAWPGFNQHHDDIRVGTLLQVLIDFVTHPSRRNGRCRLAQLFFTWASTIFRVAMRDASWKC
jgi:hypothetical protein